MKKYSYAFALLLSLMATGQAFAAGKGKKVNSQEKAKHSRTR